MRKLLDKLVDLIYEIMPSNKYQLTQLIMLLFYLIFFGILLLLVGKFILHLVS